MDIHWKRLAGFLLVFAMNLILIFSGWFEVGSAFEGVKPLILVFGLYGLSHIEWRLLIIAVTLMRGSGRQAGIAPIAESQIGFPAPLLETQYFYDGRPVGFGAAGLAALAALSKRA